MLGNYICVICNKLHMAFTFGAVLASSYGITALAAPVSQPLHPVDPVLLLTAASDPGALPQATPKTSSLPQIVLDYSHFSGSLTQAQIEGTPGKPVKLSYGNELTIESQKLYGDLIAESYTAEGGVHVHDLDTDLWSSSLNLNNGQSTIEADSVVVHQRPYLLGADTLRGNAQLVTALHATFSTAPPGEKPVLHLRAAKILYYPQRGLAVLRHASFYLFNTRLFELPYASYQSTSGPGSRSRPKRQTKPVFGVSGLYGGFAGVDVQQPTSIGLHYGGVVTSRAAPQLYLYASESLLHQHTSTAPPTGALEVKKTPLETLHDLATADHGPLSYGDPLLFHDFLTDKNPIQLFNRQATSNLSISEAVTSRLPGSGNDINNLYVSRLPELGAHVTVPITPPAADSINSDHASFRTSLRRFVLLAHGDVYGGYYREERPGVNPINHGRVEEIFRVDTEPYLIARNTVVVPSITLTGNTYSGTRNTYSYLQTSFAVNHYFTDRMALGIQYSQATTSGKSPFNFDTLDTTRELDTRLQLGNHRFAIEGLVRYDLVRESVIGYKIAIAPTMPGIIPVIEFDSTSRSVGLNLEIEGITF